MKIGVECELSMESFPHSAELWTSFVEDEKFLSDQEALLIQEYHLDTSTKKTPRYYQVNADNMNIKAIARENYYLKVNYGNKKAVVRNGETVQLTIRKESSVDQRGKVINIWYRKELKEEISKELPKRNEKPGIEAQVWKVKYMTTCWGSCNIKSGTIWLNLQLAKKTPKWIVS